MEACDLLPDLKKRLIGIALMLLGRADCSSYVCRRRRCDKQKESEVCSGMSDHVFQAEIAWAVAERGLTRETVFFI